jgi:tetratricopeptide (TPR) repeat protein
MDESSTLGRPKPVNSYEEALNLSSSGKFQAAADSFRLLALRSSNLLEKANYLIEQAECYRQLGQFEKAGACAISARELTNNDRIGSAQVEYFMATLLIAQEKREEGLLALSTILRDYSKELECDDDGRELYEQIQMQRGFALMQLARFADARPPLEEVCLSQPGKCHPDVLCHLGHCYVELGLYAVAREQFQLVGELGVTDLWAPAYHYYFGYALYELKDFAAAKRELLICLQSGTHGPPESYVFKLLAAVHRKLGEPEQARLYEKSAKLS